MHEYTRKLLVNLEKYVRQPHNQGLIAGHVPRVSPENRAKMISALKEALEALQADQ
jgi:hypothetical protein